MSDMVFPQKTYNYLPNLLWCHKSCSTCKIRFSMSTEKLSIFSRRMWKQILHIQPSVPAFCSNVLHKRENIFLSEAGLKINSFLTVRWVLDGTEKQCCSDDRGTKSLASLIFSPLCSTEYIHNIDLLLVCCHGGREVKCMSLQCVNFNF